MVNDCTKITDTECSPCSRGEFLDSWNRETRCHPHRYCDPNQGLLVLSEGTSETDTICICDEGQHCVNEACEMCSPHSPCSAGFGVKKNATRVSDTICEPCLVGFFSNVSSAYEECQPWTRYKNSSLVFPAPRGAWDLLPFYPATYPSALAPHVHTHSYNV
uniref:Tumor necrosis factor receptor superfamily member 5 n=1 Tax=Molossus molossus TaxID=27622 RepID=A0A7J8HFM7_MOLMO|nr:CD40 molecule [Molossus molossus]